MVLSTSRPTVHDELARALVDGPFSRALALAISRRGLTLGRVKDRLHAAGVSVSVTTLSNWQSGNTVPNRRTFNRTVALLETVLDLAPGALVGLVERGKVGRADGPVRTLRPERLWGPRNPVLPVLHSLYDSDTGLVLSALHERLDVDADRCQRRLRVQEVLRANRDHARTKFIKMQGVPGFPPRLVDTRHCTARRVQAHTGPGLTVAEVLLSDVPLHGESAIIEYEWEYTAPEPDVSWQRLFRHPVHSHVMQLQFATDVTPVTCHSFRLQSATGPEREVSPLRLTEDHSGHVYTVNAQPGIQGIRWEWS